MWSNRAAFRTLRTFCTGRINTKPVKEALSSFTDVFNSNPAQNEIFTRRTTGLFNIPELSRPTGFSCLQNNCIIRTEELIQEATSNARSRKMVEIFDEMSDCLCRVADLAEFVRLAHPVLEFSKAAEKVCIAVSEIVEELNTNKKLYDNLKKSVLEGDVTITTDVDNLVGELFLFDFEQNGIHLPENLRNAVVMLNNTILALGQKFVHGSDAPRIIKKSEIPVNIQNSFMSDGDNLIISGLFIDSLNPMTREIAYKTFYHPNSHQEVILQKLIECRYKLARTCGFQSYAERVLRGGTLDSTADVMNFLETTSNSIKEISNIDFEIMRKMKTSENQQHEELAVWDVPYYITKAKNEWFKVTQKEFCPYFSLGTCMDGLNIIFKNLYGISLVNIPISKGECWSNSVYKLAVEHETEGILGYIYCDFYERSGKQNQDCHFTIRGGRELSDSTYQIPIAVLMLNFKAPSWREPVLLTPNNVDNLFHEMGHAMHSMLARTKYQHVTGTRCSTDFAEVPSVLMEYFAADPRILRMFARHFNTNLPIPEDMLQRFCVSKKAFTACETNMQIFYSVLDQLFHSDNPLETNNTKVIAELQEKYYGLEHVPNTAWHLRFSHLVGYGAKYYSYLVSRSVAHYIWHKYFQSDPLNRQNGERYRRECLAHGGGKNPKKLVGDFLGIEVLPEVLATSLVREISENNAVVQNFCDERKIC